MSNNKDRRSCSGTNKESLKQQSKVSSSLFSLKNSKTTTTSTTTVLVQKEEEGIKRLKPVQDPFPTSYSPLNNNCLGRRYFLSGDNNPPTYIETLYKVMILHSPSIGEWTLHVGDCILFSIDTSLSLQPPQEEDDEEEEDKLIQKYQGKIGLVTEIKTSISLLECRIVLYPMKKIDTTYCLQLDEIMEISYNQIISQITVSFIKSHMQKNHLRRNTNYFCSMIEKNGNIISDLEKSREFLSLEICERYLNNTTIISKVTENDNNRQQHRKSKLFAEKQLKAVTTFEEYEQNKTNTTARNKTIRAPPPPLSKNLEIFDFLNPATWTAECVDWNVV